MSNFPHFYVTTTEGNIDPILKLSSEQGHLPPVPVSAPPEFGGPDGYWSPETLFSASVSSCFILTFKFVAQMMKLSWEDIKVEANAKLDKQGGKILFTHVDIAVTLELEGEDGDLARKVLEKAKESCLITNSINAEISLHSEIQCPVQTC